VWLRSLRDGESTGPEPEDGPPKRRVWDDAERFGAGDVIEYGTHLPLLVVSTDPEKSLGATRGQDAYFDQKPGGWREFAPARHSSTRSSWGSVRSRASIT